MPATILGSTLVATKMADGTVQCVWSNANGQVRFIHVFTSGDFTSINTTVNGGTSGATVTIVYAQDANRLDYPSQAPQEV